MKKDLVGFIGLGAMGKCLVPHLLKAGHQVFVCDVSNDAVAAMVMLGAARCETPRQVADNAEVVLICVPTPDIVEQVVLGEAGVCEGSRVAVLVDHSTTGPTIARHIADELNAHNIAALDAPLAGGVSGAKAGTLSVMVGGDKKAYERCESIFQSFGKTVVHVGSAPGLGQVLKLTNNMIVGATLIATCEAVLFGIKSGLNPQQLLEIVNASTARSFTSEIIVGKAILERTFDFGFRMDLMRKDLRLFLSESEAVGAPTFTSSVVKQFFDQAIAAGLGNEDMSTVVCVLESLADTQIK